MPVTIDIRKSSIYKEGKIEGKIEGKAEGKIEGKIEGKAEGKIEGKAEGKIEGKAEGKIETQTKIALSMLETGKYPLEEISGLTQMSLADIEALRSKKA